MSQTLILPGSTAAPPGTTEVVTLERIEQEVARRAGPFLWERASSSTQNSVVIERLISTIESIEWPMTYLLRRGVMYGTSVPLLGFDTRDRVRVVKSQTSLTGTLLVDRDWYTQPIPDESIELHHLHPDHELRRAVLNGLRRCYFIDQTTIQAPSAAYQRNLTELAPWVIPGVPVYGVDYEPMNGIVIPRKIEWWDTYQKGSSVWLKTVPDYYPNAFVLSSRRSHFTWVNGIYAPNGPIHDYDTFNCSLEYAVAAGHIEAWRVAKARMHNASIENNAVTQVEAATIFTRVAADNFQPPRDIRIQFNAPVRRYYNEESYVIVD